jgi:hypothetical protein
MAGPARKARASFALVIDEMQDLEADLLGVLPSVQHVAGKRAGPTTLWGATLHVQFSVPAVGAFIARQKD